LEALQNSFKVCPKVYAFWKPSKTASKYAPKCTRFGGTSKTPSKYTPKCTFVSVDASAEARSREKARESKSEVAVRDIFGNDDRRPCGRRPSTSTFLLRFVVVVWFGRKQGSTKFTPSFSFLRPPRKKLSFRSPYKASEKVQHSAMPSRGKQQTATTTDDDDDDVQQHQRRASEIPATAMPSM